MDGIGWLCRMGIATIDAAVILYSIVCSSPEGIRQSMHTPVQHLFRANPETQCDPALHLIRTPDLRQHQPEPDPFVVP